MTRRPFVWILLPAVSAGLMSTTPSVAQTLTTLYSFSSSSALSPTNRDGAYPRAGLLLSGSSLYGTAKWGGTSSNGTVFALNADAGHFTNLHSFSAVSSSRTNLDGANPMAALTMAGGRLYGTSRVGGTSSNGTVFALNMDGTGFTNLHNFTGVSWPNATNRDGANPGAALVLSGGTLYGTTEYGGASGKGAVFAINTDGSGFTNLYSFSAVNAITLTNRDGANPAAGLLVSGNTLYGVAQFGGRAANGTVFALNTNGGGFVNLHSFPAFFGTDYTNTEGANPLGDLVLAGNTLYGTTEYGDTNGNGGLFALNTDGSGFRNLYGFTALDAATATTNRDGANPRAGLCCSGNTLYGVAQFGGPAGNGTLFAINTNGAGFTNLHSFTGNPSYTNSDGVWPSGLLAAGTTLYGTAEYGGAWGSGTLFMLSLASSPMPPTRLIPTGYSPASGFQFTITNADGTAITSAEQSRMEVLVNTNVAAALANWIVLTNATVLTNGVLQVQDPASVASPRRFYRALLKP